MDAWEILSEAGFIFLAYFLGSIPFGLVLTRVFTLRDVRKEGSGNIGATNVYRAAGAVPAVLTLAADALKGAVPVYVAGWLQPDGAFHKDIFLCSVGFSAFIGHLYPVFLRFKTGGKGVATAAGCFLALCPWALFVSLIVFAVFLRFSGRVSIGSLAASVGMPIAARTLSCSDVVVGFAVLFAFFIFFRHWDNIRRLQEGKEPAFHFRRIRK